MGRDRSYAIGAYRAKHYPTETAAGVTIGEHYAVEIMTRDGWKGVSVHPDALAAVAACDQRRKASDFEDHDCGEDTCVCADPND